MASVPQEVRAGGSSGVEDLGRAEEKDASEEAQHQQRESGKHKPTEDGML